MLCKTLSFSSWGIRLRGRRRGGDFVSPIFYAENALFFRVIAAERKRTQAMQEGFVTWASHWSGKRVDEPANQTLA